MTIKSHRNPHAQRGVVLIAALLLLIVMTILAMTMFRTNGVQELIAGNVREKQRALQSAEAAEQYAEVWLATSGNVLTNGADCSAVNLVPYPSTSSPAICVATLETITGNPVSSIPWKVGANEVGFLYYPGTVNGGTTSTGDMIVQTTPTANSYYQVPRFYITLLQNTANLAMYRVDAWNWAGTQNTSAVVESNYVVTCSTCPL